MGTGDVDVPACPGCWCEEMLQKLIDDGTIEKEMKKGASGDNVKRLHEHLDQFNFEAELKDASSGMGQQTDDVKSNKWGRYTTRAVRMFAAHPENKVTAPDGKALDGTKLTKELAAKIIERCKGGWKSIKDYRKALEAYKALGYVLRTKKGTGAGQVVAIDALGNDKDSNKTQTVLHHHVRQLQRDLDSIIDEPAKQPALFITCLNANLSSGTYDYKPTGDADDKHGRYKYSVTAARVKLLQRQAARSLRMVVPATGDPSFITTGFTTYAGSADGVVNDVVAKEIETWKTNRYRLFGFRDISANVAADRPAKFQAQIAQKWENAKREVERLGGFMPSRCTDTPRTLGTHNTTAGGPIEASLHKTGRAIDFEFGDFWSAPPPSGAGKPAPTPPGDKYVPVKEDVGTNTRWHAYVRTADQDDASNTAKASAHLTKVTGGTLKAWRHEVNATGGREVTVADGWYVNVSAVLETFGFHRIFAKGAWKTTALSEKTREYWHYQVADGILPTWGEEVMIVGYTEDYLKAENYDAYLSVATSTTT